MSAARARFDFVVGVMPPRRRDVGMLQDLRVDIDGQFLLVEGDGGPGAAVGVQRVAGALGIADADSCLDGGPFGDLADRLGGVARPMRARRT
jgi:hypothetical protein